MNVNGKSLDHVIVRVAEGVNVFIISRRSILRCSVLNDKGHSVGALEGNRTAAVRNDGIGPDDAVDQMSSVGGKDICLDCGIASRFKNELDGGRRSADLGPKSYLTALGLVFGNIYAEAVGMGSARLDIAVDLFVAVGHPGEEPVNVTAVSALALAQRTVSTCMRAFYALTAVEGMIFTLLRNAAAIIGDGMLGGGDGVLRLLLVVILIYLTVGGSALRTDGGVLTGRLSAGMRANVGAIRTNSVTERAVSTGIGANGALAVRELVSNLGLRGTAAIVASLVRLFGSRILDLTFVVVRVLASVRSAAIRAHRKRLAGCVHGV